MDKHLLTDDEIQVGLNLCEEATPGEFCVSGRNNTTTISNFCLVGPCGETHIAYVSNNADAQLFARARTLLPQALQQLQELLPAARAVLAVNRQRQCQHGEEWNYCDSCLYDYQKEMMAALQALRAVLEAQ